MANLTDPLIGIGTMAEKLAISVSSIRRYEEMGLIIPHRSQSGHRLFSHEDIERLRMIRFMIQELGLGVEGIRRMQALLPCWELANCKVPDKSLCPVFRELDKPCWMLHQGEPDQQCRCRECVVYRYGSQHILNVKKILHHGESRQCLPPQ